MTYQDQPVLSVKDLAVSFPSEAGTVDAVRGVSFDLKPGKTLAIVGESGSGKSVTSMAIMGLLPEYASITGSAQLDGRELIGLSDKAMADIRGNDIGMIFQDPLSALTPVFDVGSQIVEVLQRHNHISRSAAMKQAVELLDLVGIPDPKNRVRAFPHEFSGGMRQRVVIAIAIANKPKVLIADEPTTALDVTIQAQILELIKLAQRETNAATIMITHDMGVVAGTADDVIVMYAGRPVENAEVNKLFANPKMPYTIGLMGSIPDVTVKEKHALTTIEGNPPIVVNLPDECTFAPRCPLAGEACLAKEPELREVAPGQRAACIRSEEIEGHQINGKPVFPPLPLASNQLAQTPREEREVVLDVKDLVKTFPLMKGSLLKRRVGTVYAVNGLTFDIRSSECLAIVGESGCGKSTTLLEIMDLDPHEGTQIFLTGDDASKLSGRARRLKRRDIQVVFQDPMGALDPRMTVAEILREPLNSLGWEGDKNARIYELMELVGLNPAHVDRFPGHFSGGQRQRICVARALAASPKLLVLDEPVSALDVSIQAGLLNLLDELKVKLGISYLFVAHDLSVIRHISDRAAVMYLGRFVEQGDTDAIFDSPKHPYTKALLSAIPIADPEKERNRERIVLEDSMPSPTTKIVGCSFRSRCPLYKQLPEDKRKRCEGEDPITQAAPGVDHAVRCHWADMDIAASRPLG